MSQVGGPLPLRSPGSIAPQSPVRGPGRANAAGSGFERELDAALGTTAPVRFSAHAAERLRQRGIQLSGGDLQRLGQAVDLAAAKGGRESLVLAGPLAYVVSVPSRTVVTALAGDQLRGSVFTQIDSTVVY